MLDTFRMSSLETKYLFPFGEGKALLNDFFGRAPRIDRMLKFSRARSDQISIIFDAASID